MLSDTFLARLDAFALRAGRAATGGAGGMRRSKALGSSAEFSDFREYVAGDDIRHIDWNAFARFDRLFLKLFMEEKQQRLNLILDASASMGFGKWQAAVQLCQALGYVGLCGGDSVVLYTLSGNGVHSSQTFSGRYSYARLAALVEQTQPHGSVKLDTVVPRLLLPQGQGICFLISDLLCEDGYEKALSSLLYRKQEVTLVQLWSREELEPTMEGTAELIDSENGQKLTLNASYDTLKRYRETARTYVQQAQRFCHARGITHAFVVPETAFEEQMLRVLCNAGLIA